MNKVKSQHFLFNLIYKTSVGLIYTSSPNGDMIEFSLSRGEEKDDLADIITAATSIRKSASDESNCGSWSFVADRHRGVFYFEFRGIRCYVGEHKLFELIDLVLQVKQ